MCRITHYEQRLNTLFYKKKFAVSVSEIEPKITAVLEASKEVSRSKKLKKLLEIILALGNYMNRGQRGNAAGFRISSLNRLSDTKSSSSKSTTLLHYLVSTLETKVISTSKNHKPTASLTQFGFAVQGCPEAGRGSSTLETSLESQVTSRSVYHQFRPLHIVIRTAFPVSVWSNWRRRWISYAADWKRWRKSWNTTERRVKWWQCPAIVLFRLSKSSWRRLPSAFQILRTISKTWKLE